MEEGHGIDNGEQVDEISERSKEEGKRSAQETDCSVSVATVEKLAQWRRTGGELGLPTSSPASAVVWPPFVVSVKEL